MTARTVLALDVGGTKILAALAGEDGSFVTERERPTGGVTGADPGLAATQEVCGELLALAAGRGMDIVAIGAGFPEYVREGRLTSSEVLEWRRQPADLLGVLAPGIPVVVESDVRCGALAEFAAMRATNVSGDGPRSLYYLSWGTGLSGALVLDGTCMAGSRGEAIAFGELGIPLTAHMGHDGTLESYASGAGMVTRYSALTGRKVDGAASVFEAAAAGDRQASAVVDSAGEAVGTALAWVVALMDPAVVVLGGGIGSGPALTDTPVADTYQRLTARRPAGPPLRRARNGSRSSLVGAAMFAARSVSNDSRSLVR